MSRITEIRIRLLAAIAIGLATALIVHAVTRESTPTMESLWRFATTGSDEGPVVSMSSEELPTASNNEGSPKVATPTPRRGGGLLIDGGDYTGPDDTPTPAVSPSPTPLPASDGDDDNDGGGAGSANGVSVDVPVVGTPTSSGDDDFMVGGRTSRGGAYAPPTPVTDPEGTGWVGGQPRGYAMLYALQPEARPVVEANMAALLGAQVREPFIGVLVDGTFGKDFGYLRELIQRLNTDGRNLHLALYLANGPAQRRSRPPYEAPFVRSSPEEFRREIRRSNSDAQIEYLKILSDARRLFEYNILTNPDSKNYAVVMLEDNLERDSFRAMSILAREQVGAVATIIRNPCKGCYAGNDDESLGFGVEEHHSERVEFLQPGDALTLDGQGFLYPGEVGDGKPITAERVVSLSRSAHERKLAYFGLWRESWQGAIDGALSDPKTRTYKPSTPAEIAFEREALRAGLPLVNSDDLEADAAEPNDNQFFDQMGSR